MSSGGRKLAIHGGQPLFPKPPAWPVYDPEVEQVALEALRDGTWGQYHSPHTEQLSRALETRIGVSHSRLCCSGTFGIELALRGLQIGPGDGVILAAYDFPGNFRAIEAVGARPVLVDIRSDDWCIDVGQVEGGVNATTRAVIASHMHGGLVDMRQLCDLGSRHGLAVVEDVCQAPGAIVQGRQAGAWGDVSVFSFGGSKLLTAGRGGAVLTRHADVAQRMTVFAERGNDAFPLSQLQAAVLMPQLAKLEARNAHRWAMVRRLIQAVEELPGLRPLNRWPAESRPAFFKHAWMCGSEASPPGIRERWLAALAAEGIQAGEGFRGFARRSQRRCDRIGSLTNARLAAEKTLLLHHPVLLQERAAIDLLVRAFRDIQATVEGETS